jgi:hypothetical protein
VITGGGILDQGPLAVGGGEAAGFPDFKVGSFGSQKGAQGGPIEAEIGAHARVGADADIVLEEEGIQTDGHGKIR